MRLLKILFLSYYYFPHVGAGTWSVHEIVQRLSENAVVHLLLPNVRYSTMINFYQSETVNKGYSVSTFPKVKLPSKLAAVISGFLLFIKGLSFRNIDVIVSRHQPNHTISVAALLLSKVMRKPWLVTAADVYRTILTEKGAIRFLFPVKVFGTVVENLLTIHADVIGVVCSENRDILISRFGEKAKNVLLFPNGIDYNKMAELKGCLSDIGPRIRKQLGVSSDTKIIIYVGRIGSAYGLESLLRALPRLKKAEKVHILLVGEGREVERLLALAKDLKILNNVSITGAVSREKALEYLSVADIAIGPLGSTASINLKVLEYFALGKPVVSAIGSISRDIAINGENCLLVKLKPESIASAILRLLKDNELRRKLEINSVKTAITLDWNNTVARIFHHIYDLVQ